MKFIILKTFQRIFLLPLILIPISISTLFAQGIPQENDSFNLEEKQNNQEIKDPFEKSNSKLKYFSINPGVTLESVTVDISGRGNNATMTQEGPGEFTWMFDVKSRDFQISQYVGIHLLLHNSNFYLNNQFVARPAEFSSPEEDSSTNSGPSGNRIKQDVNTRMQGFYSMTMPILYLGEEGSDNYRLGFGFGPSNIRLNGQVDFQNPNISATYLLSDISNRENFLNTVTTIQFLTGNISPTSGDPTVSYLIGNLSTGRNLEALGLYYAANDLLKPDPLAFYFLSSTPGLYTPLEALTLASLSRSQVNIAKRNAFAFLFFFETPKFGPVKFRLSFGGPIFKENGYTYEFRTFHLALFAPIEF
ncbi:MAG: hypothetical protein MH321_14385 [Leptospiraceae bacterium]|nr:hypothetical protein [Leptospiraceae bacterium]